MARNATSGRGMVLTQCRPEAAVAWCRRGLGPAVVGHLEGFSVVVPSGPPRARYPYDDAVRTLAGRPVGMRMRPALGFFHIGRQAVITVHAPRWRAVHRWMIWTPRDGSLPPDGLAQARPSDIVAVAGTLHGAAAAAGERALRDLLADGTTDAGSVLAGSLSLLALPGAGLLTGDLAAEDLPDAREVVPRERYARAFERLLSEDDRDRIESEA